MRTDKKKKIPQSIWFWAGLVLVLCQAVPFLVLGQDVVVNYHDQLDGEMIAYILQARHILQGDFLPEFMGGVSKTALIPPAPMCVLLFGTGQYFAAYVLMQLGGALTGYLGMYLLAGKVTKRRWVAVMAGILFAYLPFLPVYGLSQFGIPLLLWCFLQLREGRMVRISLAYLVFYVLNSSLVLVGFGVLGILALGIVLDWFCNLVGTSREVGSIPVSGKTVSVRIFRLWLAWGLMLLTYVLENAGLLLQMISSTDVSHKAEYNLNSTPFSAGFREAFLNGGQHSEDYHIWILAAVLMTGAVLLICGNGIAETETDNSMEVSLVKRKLKEAGVLIAILVFLAFTAALWSSPAIVSLRSKMQALGAFQADRVLWISPCFWYLLAAWAIDALVECMTRIRHGWLRLLPFVSMLLGITAMGLTGLLILRNGNWKANLFGMSGWDYKAISYKEYYAIGVLEQVEQFIRENTGMEQSEYRVASLGIDPAAAYYHGFYGLDGYSNNYSLDYKHRFRKVIATELEKSDYLKNYFDNWGNRCYLLSAECPAYYTVEKTGFFFQDYEPDNQALKDLGCRYILSAAYIQNGQDVGLSLVREEPFETPDSYYRIFLYEME